MRSIDEVEASVTLVGWSITFLTLNLLKLVGSVLDFEEFVSLFPGRRLKLKSPGKNRSLVEENLLRNDLLSGGR